MVLKEPTPPYRAAPVQSAGVRPAVHADLEPAPKPAAAGGVAGVDPAQVPEARERPALPAFVVRPVRVAVRVGIHRDVPVCPGAAVQAIGWAG